MSSNKYKIVAALAIILVFAGFMLYLKPSKLDNNNTTKQAVNENKVFTVISGKPPTAFNDNIVSKNPDLTEKKKKEAKAALQEAGESTEPSSLEVKGYKVTGEDDFVEYVELPNGTNTPLFKSYAAGNEEEIEADFAFEKRNEEWASNWEYTLNNVISNAASTFDMAESKITCKSKICKIGVKLKENNSSSYNDAYSSLNREFVLNDIKVVPGAMKEKGTGYIIHYFIPKK